ncbi:tetratricopeptide repeat protein [Aequorivita sp. Q41]|uniref:tetratricopeptide repeat protein n=1 Tax=Aequorivita sp. Q41 TaxID=3153300 RepID=UPI00324242DC
MEIKGNDLFIAYLEETLAVAERNAFEKKLAEDSSFSEAFYEFKSIYKVLENQFSEERVSFVESVKKADSKFRPQANTLQSKGKLISFKPWQYGVAASILLVIGFFLFNDSNKPTYIEYAAHEDISLTVRSNTSKIAKKAEANYNVGNYKEALSYFDALLQEQPDNAQFQYYKATALVEINRFEEADNLLKVLYNGPSVYASKAKWVAALSMLKQEKYKEVINLLETIPSTTPEYKKAQKLLSALQ